MNNLLACVETIQAGLPGWLTEAKTPGAAVALLEPGQPPHYICAGRRSPLDDQPVSTHTVFEAASLGKPIFAYGVLRLAAESRLNLDAPVGAIVPEELIPGEARAAAITPRQVLSHCTGLPNWFHPDQPRALKFSPGERFGYSGEGYCFLQRAVEHLTGLALDDFARQRVFEPLGMARSTYLWPAAYQAETARGVDREGEPKPLETNITANAAASLYTSLVDYTCFLGQFLSADALLADPWRQLMMQSATPIDESTAWGLGWGQKIIAGQRVLWQWGDNFGFKHLAAAVPARGQAVCVLTNGENGWQVWSQVLAATLDPGGEIVEFLDKLN